MKSCCLPPLAVLLSGVVFPPKRLQRSSGFVSTVPASKKKPSDGGSPGVLFIPSGRPCVSVSIGAKKGVSDEEGDSVLRSDLALALAAIEKKGAKRKTTTGGTKRKRTTSTEPPYWRDENDPFVIVANRKTHVAGAGAEDDDSMKGDIRPSVGKSIKFTIRGNPNVLKRHRTARGFMYNPSRAKQDAFRDCLLEMLPRKHHPIIIDDESLEEDAEGNEVAASPPTVFFAEQDFVKLTITFRMKRPMSHFVSNRPAIGRLKPTAPGKLHAVRSDVDNLAKFVMDALNGVLYVDDRQVVSLHAVKVLDSEGLCRGATDIEMSALGEEDFV